MSAARVPIPASDQTWLHMDRPNNLMHVHSLMWFESPPSVDAVRQVIRDRVIDRYPVFTRRPVEHRGRWFWEDVGELDLDRHVGVVPLGGDVDTLRAWVGGQFSAPLDPDRPLWQVELVEGVEGVGTVLFSRFHHALADGVRLTQLMLSLCDLVEDGADALPPQVGRHAARGLFGAGASAVRRGIGDAVDLTAGALRLPVRAVTSLGPQSFEQGLELVLQPSRLLDVVAALGSEDNQTVNTLTEVTRLLTAPRSVRTAWSGVPGVGKGVAWVTGLDLERVKQVGREHDATVNDVLLALVSRALSAYLREQDALVDEIAWLVPVSLQPLDENLPEELGNHFSLVFLSMPLGIADLAGTIAAVRSRMTRLKHSAEPVVSFGLQWVVAETPRLLSTRVTNLFANKGVGVLTNVPGPRRQMTFAGVPVAGMLGWAPTSGNQPMSLCIVSYHGTVNIGIAADSGLVPEPERIAQLIEAEIDAW